MKLTLWLVSASCIADLVWWVGDFALYADRPDVVLQFSRFRVLILVMGLLYLLTVTRRPFRTLYVYWGTLLGGTTLFGTSAALGSLGGIEAPYFAALYFAPMMTMAFMVPPPLRVALTAVLVVAVGAGFFGMHPQNLQSPGVPTAAGLMLFGAGISVVAGHLVFWSTGSALRHRFELEAVTAVLSDGFAERTRELGLLARQLEQLRESERAAVARDLHDEFGQVLTGMRLELDMAHRIHQQGGDLGPQHQRLGNLLDETFSTTRRLMEHLRPRVLEDAGLLAGLKWLAQDAHSRTGLLVQMTLPATIEVSEPVATTVYRVVQECLTNVQRHAKAEAAHVRLMIAGDRVEVSVEDDGCGLPAPDERREGAVGLVGMRERAGLLGGVLDLGRSKSGGTLVTLRLPDTMMEPS